MTPEQPISFARGAPSVDIVDVAALKAAATRAFDEDASGMVGYGNSFGYPPLRRWIAQRHGVQADQVLVTNGSLQADWFLFNHLVRPGDPVVVERPTYDRTLRNLRALGADVHQIGLESDGLEVEKVRKLVESGVVPRLAHVIPNFQNPTGITMSATKRQALVELAAESGFTIFEDDPYAEIRFHGEPLPSMLAADKHDVVVHAGSFTKTVCPGVRVGYLVGPRQVIAAIAKVATNMYISPSMAAQGIVYQFCRSGAIETSIATVRAALAERSALLARALREYLPDARFREPDGGYFVWVELPEDVHVDALAPEAAARGVEVVKGSDFLLYGGDHALRLAYSAVTADRVSEGVRRLADAVNAVRTGRRR